MRKYLIAGILVWLPLGVTVLVIKLLVDAMDQTLLLLPPQWRPEALFGVDIPGLGVVLSALVIFVTGVLVANLLGRTIFRLWEGLLTRIPFVRPVYTAVKQIVETVFSDQSEAFKKVIMVEYPRQGNWAIAFQTGTELGEVQRKTGVDVVAAYIPTTPNPTSGFVLMVPKDEIIELDMSVDEGLKFIVSMGVVCPAAPAKVAPSAGTP